MMAVGRTPSLHNVSRRTSTGQPLTSTTAPVSRDLPTGDYYLSLAKLWACTSCPVHSGHHSGRESPFLLPHKGGESTHVGRGSKSSDDKIAFPPPGAFRTAVMAIGVRRSPSPHPLFTFWVRYIICPLFKTSICFVSACTGMYYGTLKINRDFQDPGLSFHSLVVRVSNPVIRFD